MYMLLVLFVLCLPWSAYRHYTWIIHGHVFNCRSSIVMCVKHATESWTRNDQSFTPFLSKLPGTTWVWTSLVPSHLSQGVETDTSSPSPTTSQGLAGPRLYPQRRLRVSSNLSVRYSFFFQRYLIIDFDIHTYIHTLHVHVCLAIIILTYT